MNKSLPAPPKRLAFLRPLPTFCAMPIANQLATTVGLARSLAIYYGRPWRNADLARFYAGLIRPGDLAIDVGAHVGHRTRALRRAGARVVAMEPQAAFARFLRATLPADVTLIEAAAGAAEATASMAVSRLHPTVSSLASAFVMTADARPGFAHVRWPDHQPVTVITLETVIARHGLPAFIKIDVEGFEAEVLAGLRNPVPLIAFEFLPGLPSATQACLDQLPGHRFNVVLGEANAFLWPDWRPRQGVERWLSGLRADSASGDLYARPS